MKDAFVNRMAMFQTSLSTLLSPEHRSVWSGDPVIFQEKVKQAEDAVADLESFAQQLEATSTGATERKKREQRELEDAAFLFGTTLAIWFTDQGDEQNAAAVDMTISDWRKLRDQALLDKSRFLLQLFQQVVDGPSASDAAEYGITVDGVQRLSTEIDGYADVITAPQQSIANSAGLRKQLRGRFNEVEACFDVLDRLIHHFAHTSDGRDLISAYQASRVIIDRGRRLTSPQTELEAAAN